jgi:hypothetical protein
MAEPFFPRYGEKAMEDWRPQSDLNPFAAVKEFC